MNLLRRITVFLTLFSAVLVMPAFAADVAYASVLNGSVVHIVPAGTAVQRGDVLATVDSLAGPMPAVRAASAGVVKKVLVSPGTQVRQGTDIIVVEEH